MLKVLPKRGDRLRFVSEWDDWGTHHTEIHNVVVIGMKVEVIDVDTGEVFKKDVDDLSPGWKKK